jgi:hypothetical protein
VAFEFCSSLVDLVVCVHRNCRRGHRLTLPRERFVGLVAEDVAEVGDHAGDLRERRRVPRGLNSKPAMVAAGSWYPSRSRKAARIARVTDNGDVA